MSDIQKVKQVVSSQRFWLSLLVVAGGLFLLIWLTHAVLDALAYGINVSTFPTNGTFQIYNPLRRIEMGQVLGGDIPFFHGVGIPWLHFPIFKLFGSNIFAAEVAKWVVSPVIFFLSTGVFFYAFFRNSRKTIVAIGVFTVLTLLFFDVASAWGSLRGLRGTFPILIAAALLWQTKRFVDIGRFHVACNEVMALVLLGASFAFSSEHGLAAILAYLIIKAFLLWKKNKAGKLIWLAKLGAVAAAIGAVLLLTLTVLTAGHPIEALRYALVEIPADQGWYFGAPPNNFLKWDTILLVFAKDFWYMWTIIILGIAALVAILRGKQYSEQVKIASIFLLVFGVIVFAMTILGYYSPGAQIKPLVRGMGLLCVALAVGWLFSDKAIFKLRFNERHFQIPYSLIIFGIFSILLTYGIVHYGKLLNGLDIKYVVNTARQARHNDDYFAASRSWKERIDTFEPYIGTNDTLWSTYAGLYESAQGKIHPSSGGEDYIIHALGPERREQYVRQFIKEKPTFVTTMVPDFFYYEEWLLQSSWGFYGHLISNYDLIVQNESHYLWKLRKEPMKQNADWQNADKNGIYLPANNTDEMVLYEVKIKYDASAPPLKSLPRYLVRVNGAAALKYPISLPPRNHQHTFVTPIMPGEKDVSLRTSTEGLLPWASLDVKSVEYRQLKSLKDNLLLFWDNYCVSNRQKPETAKICQDVLSGRMFPALIQNDKQ